MAVAELLAGPAALRQAQAEYQAMLADGVVTGRERWAASRAAG